MVATKESRSEAGCIYSLPKTLKLVPCLRRTAKRTWTYCLGLCVTVPRAPAHQCEGINGYCRAVKPGSSLIALRELVEDPGGDA